MTTFKSKTVKAVVGLLAIAALAVAVQAQAAYTFTQNLKLGMSGAEVVEVQKFLNANGFTVSATGAGSPGMESNYFGTKTFAAVKLFQTAKGVSPVTGNWYPLTRAAANATSTPSTGALVPGCTGTTGYSPLTGQPCSGGTAPAQTGPVVASLATTNPASGVIVAGQASARLLDITFTGSGTVNSVMLKRSGISDQSTLNAVYLYDGVARLTDGYSFNNNGDITINGLGLQVSGSRTVSVVADVTAAPGISGQTIAVALTSFTAGTTASVVSVQGNVMSVASGSTLAGVTFPSAQSITGTLNVNAGTSSYAVYRQAIQVNLRTVLLKAANFRMTGSASADSIANAGLYIDGVKVGGNAVVTMTNGSNYLSFNFSAAPFSLTTGGHTLEIRTDIVKGASYNFTVALQQASDLMIMDPQVGVNIAVSSFTAYPGAVISIGAGSATFVVDPSFSSMTNVTGGASNATIAKFKIHGYGEDVKVTSLPVTTVLTGATPAAAGLQNVTLYFNGSQIGSQTSQSSVGLITFTPGSQLIIPAGADSTLEVRADLRTYGGTNYTAGTISANLGAGVGEGWSSHSSVTTPAVTGTTLAIQTGLLAVAKNTGYSSQSISPNTTAAKIGSFVLQNQSSSESVRVTGLTVGLTTDGTTVMTTGTTPALTNFSGLQTSEASGSGAIPVQPQGSNAFSVDFNLAPGATKVIDILANTSSATTGNVVATLVVSSLGSSSNVSVLQNGNGTAVVGQTIALSAGVITNSSTSPAFLTTASTAAQYIASPDGKTDGTKATYKFVSTNGSSTVSDLQFTVTGPVQTLRIGSVSAPVVAGTAWFQFPQGQQLIIPNTAQGLNVDVFATYSTVGLVNQASAISGTTSDITLSQVKYTSGGSSVTLGTGGTAFSSTLLASSTMTMTASLPTVKKTSSAVNVGTGSTSNIKVGTITVTANSGDVMIGTVPVSVGVPTGGTSSNWTVKVGGTAPAGITQPTSDTSGFSFSNGYLIQKDTSVAFDVYVDFAGVTTAGNADLTLGASSSFKWSDIADGTTTNGTMTKTGALLTTYNN